VCGGQLVRQHLFDAVGSVDRVGHIERDFERAGLLRQIEPIARCRGCHIIGLADSAAKMGGRFSVSAVRHELAACADLCESLRQLFANARFKMIRLLEVPRDRPATVPTLRLGAYARGSEYQHFDGGLIGVRLEVKFGCERPI
jgi:hypothetical protein